MKINADIKYLLMAARSVCNENRLDVAEEKGKSFFTSANWVFYETFKDQLA